MSKGEKLDSENISSQKKACPLLSIGAGGEALVECIENDCEFWIENRKRCALAVIAELLTKLVEREIGK